MPHLWRLALALALVLPNESFLPRQPQLGRRRLLLHDNAAPGDADTGTVTSTSTTGTTSNDGLSSGKGGVPGGGKDLRTILLEAQDDDSQWLQSVLGEALVKQMIGPDPVSTNKKAPAAAPVEIDGYGDFGGSSRGTSSSNNRRVDYEAAELEALLSLGYSSDDAAQLKKSAISVILQRSVGRPRAGLPETWLRVPPAAAAAAAAAAASEPDPEMYTATRRPMRSNAEADISSDYSDKEEGAASSRRPSTKDQPRQAGTSPRQFSRSSQTGEINTIGGVGDSFSWSSPASTEAGPPQAQSSWSPSQSRSRSPSAPIPATRINKSGPASASASGSDRIGRQADRFSREGDDELARDSSRGVERERERERDTDSSQRRGSSSRQSGQSDAPRRPASSSSSSSSTRQESMLTYSPRTERGRNSDSDGYSDEGDVDGEGEGPTTFWPDLAEFKSMLKAEARLRVDLLGPVIQPILSPLVREEARWRYTLYRKWLALLDEGLGDGFDVVEGAFDGQGQPSVKGQRGDYEEDDDADDDDDDDYYDDDDADAGDYDDYDEDGGSARRKQRGQTVQSQLPSTSRGPGQTRVRAPPPSGKQQQQQPEPGSRRRSQDRRLASLYEERRDALIPARGGAEAQEMKGMTNTNTNTPGERAREGEGGRDRGVTVGSSSGGSSEGWTDLRDEERTAARSMRAALGGSGGREGSRARDRRQSPSWLDEDDADADGDGDADSFWSDGDRDGDDIGSDWLSHDNEEGDVDDDFEYTRPTGGRRSPSQSSRSQSRSRPSSAAAPSAASASARGVREITSEEEFRQAWEASRARRPLPNPAPTFKTNTNTVSAPAPVSSSASTSASNVASAPAPASTPPLPAASPPPVASAQGRQVERARESEREREDGSEGEDQ